MNTRDSLQQFGLVPKDEDLPRIRDLLAHEADRERKGDGREDDLALLCCVQLFSKAMDEDVLRIWDAKSSGFDLFSSLDVQFLCGNGLQNTKNFLMKQSGEVATKALAYLKECEAAGDFEEFSAAAHLEHYRAYFGVPE
ncbi:hypothetical protein FJV80_11625 [Mesorhizobium sp. WSM4310]|uniref:hypothetical protein n=1 Tax=Mesorhizobium sp. WSM4310 TaxID=2589883 RepID=UPI00115D5DE6|nr:hypothetical protein [Mesorhizobium sp. WSM4310]TRC88917.1 hypothetical protein FJV80_11625 [Mesorhizobium sp. WSM4310]